MSLIKDLLNKADKTAYKVADKTGKVLAKHFRSVAVELPNEVIEVISSPKVGVPLAMALGGGAAAIASYVNVTTVQQNKGYNPMLINSTHPDFKLEMIKAGVGVVGAVGITAYALCVCVGADMVKNKKYE